MPGLQCQQGARVHSKGQNWETPSGIIQNKEHEDSGTKESRAKILTYVADLSYLTSLAYFLICKVREMWILQEWCR